MFIFVSDSVKQRHKHTTPFRRNVVGRHCMICPASCDLRIILSSYYYFVSLMILHLFTSFTKPFKMLYNLNIVLQI